MKRLFVLFVLSFAINLSAQDASEWLTVKLDYDISDRKPNEVFNVVDEETGNFATFYKYSRFLDARLFDENRKLISKLQFDQLPKYFNNYLGCSKSGNDYTLFFKNLTSKKFSSLTFNFSSSNFNFKDNIGVEFDKEIFVESFESNNNVYFLTAVRKSSVLKLYTLKPDSSFSIKKIDLSNEEFKRNNGLKTTLFAIVRGLKNPVETNSVKTKEPSSLEIASAKNKIYFENDIITYTFNCFDSYTGIITININDGSYVYKRIENINFIKKERGNKTNSFVYDDYFFNMYTTRERLAYDIYDLNNLELIKSLSIDRKKEITFKNSPIILEGGELANYRELDRTAQFLRKISNSNISTFVYKKDNRFVITIGSSEPREAGGVVYFYGGGLPGALIAAAGNMLITAAFESYSNTKSTRIECVFDEQFNHVLGEVPLNGFDKIKQYVESNNLSKAKLQTVFKYEDDYIFGYLNKTSNSYIYILVEN